jgi:hypothetical protein
MSTENNKDFQWTDSLVEEFHQWYAENKGKFEDHLREFKFQKLNGEKRHPEYEIVSMKCKTSGVLYHNKQQISHCLQRSNFYAIHSVRRLSDGEVFSVGDQIDATGEKCRIIGFNVAPNWSGGLMVCTDETKDSASALKLITKLPTPKPIFRTEDGVDLFSISDTVYGVCPKGTWETRELGLLLEPNKTNWKWFAIPYNRDRYILMNKPTLSVNEVLDIFRDHEVFDELVSALHERAKAKL